MPEDAKTRFPNVFAPVQIGPHDLKHRVIMTPHGVAWGGSNMPYDRQRRYYTERARGGVALVHVGATTASRRYISDDGPPTVPSDDRAIDLYRPFADDVHSYDAKVFVELAEGGVHDRGRRADGTWRPILGVSDIPSVVQNESPRVLDKTTMAEIREDQVKAVLNLREAGVDGVTVHAAHSYLFGQFMSPAYNTRTDEYGGSLKNNARFIIEVFDAIRDAVGSTMAVGLRVSYDEYLGERGLHPDLSDEYIAHFCGHGGFDFFDISAGGYHTGERYVPPQVLPWAVMSDNARRAREIVDGRALIVMAHRVNTVARAEQLLAAGVADLIGIARGHIADPELVNKTFEGHEAEISLCVGSNECVYNSHLGMGLACTVNPAAGREKAWGIGTLTNTAKAKNVVVIGAGPAGMKTAEVAARRGHTVTVVEKEAQAGGSLNLLASLPGQSQWNALTEQLLAKLDVAGVELRLSEEATRDSVLALNPDAVVIATGSRWDDAGLVPANPGSPGIEGVEGNDRVLTIDVAVRRHLERAGSLGSRIVIMDQTGAYLPLGAAELFTEGDYGQNEVTIISPRHYVGEIPKDTWELPLWWKRVGARNIATIPYHVVTSIHDSTVTYRDYQNTHSKQIENVDTFVLSGVRHSVRELYGELISVIAEVHVIGDADAPRRPADAVYDGEKIGRQL